MRAWLGSRLICHGCGFEVASGTAVPFRCPVAIPEDDLDHLLRKIPEQADAVLRAALARDFDAPSGRPFVDFRRLSLVYHRLREGGLSDKAYLRRVERLDEQIARVDDGGFRATPFTLETELSRSIGLGDQASIWVKDETGNVSGSHKGRHLMSLLLWLETVAAAGTDSAGTTDLGIASCGNAALAAAVLAKAAGRSLRVFVPPDAHPQVLSRLSELGAHPNLCSRIGDRAGDPCYHSFRAATDAGEVIPFTCQGSENGLVIDGGETLAYEMVASLRAAGATIDRIFIQVGGGALASAVIAGLRIAVRLGLLPALPRIHAVQTVASPLLRAWRRVAAEILFQAPPSIGPPPTDAASDARCGRLIPQLVPPQRIRTVLHHAARHRSVYMQPWKSTPRSIATGILDDETYDWLAVVEGMLDSGGWPVTVPEERLAKAHRIARQTTGIPAEPTGTAGLAGLMKLLEFGLVGPGETHAVLLTGVER